VNRVLIRSLAVVLAVAAVLTLTSVSFADHSWANYHWARTANPFTVKLGDNVSSGWDSYLATTSVDWSVSSVLDTVIVAGGTRPRQCRATLGRAEVCSDKYGFNGWLGIASIWASGDHITQSVVKVNDSYFNTATYNTPAWRNLVMCQEVGHAFGLDHQDENFNNTPLGTCMDYSNDPNPNQHPNAHDYEQLETIYAHLDGTTTVGPSTVAPPAMNEISLDGPGQWGRLVDVSHDGATSVFELDFGGGHKVITFVTWADPDLLSRRPEREERH
jgi:hypothetical protein